MIAVQHPISRALAFVAFLSLVLLASACAEQEQPLALGDRAPATPTPTEMELAKAAAEATATPTPVPLPTSVPVVIPTPPSTPTPAPTSTNTPVPTPEPTTATVPAGRTPEPTAESPSTAPAPEPTATPVPEPTTAPVAAVEPTHTPVPIPSDYNRRTQGPPRDELIKFAQWGENRVKLSNWVAGYIVAHGLDHPVRVIDMNPEDYKDGLPHADIDIVMEADPVWAKPYADAGILILLGPLSDASPGTVVAVNASIWRRAPKVGQFLERYEWSAEQLNAESQRIRGGRIAVRENTIGLGFIKEQQPAWSQWVDAGTVAAIEGALEAGKVSHCRKVEERQSTGSVVRVCVDDPSKATCPGCQ